MHVKVNFCAMSSWHCQPTASKCPWIQMHVTATHFPLSSLRSLCDPFLLPDGQPARFGEFLFLSRVSSQPPAIIFTLPISFDPDLCLCHIPVVRWSTAHCEISGWGMQEYNNTASYPDSVRAARIEVTGICCCHDYIWCYVRFVDWMI